MKPLPFLADPSAPSAGESRSPVTPAVRSPRRPAVIVPVQDVEGTSVARTSARIAKSGMVDVIEWRIDPLTAAAASARTAAEEVLGILPQAGAAGLPVLITLRTADEGGQVEIGEEDYAEVLERIVSAASAEAPVAVDVELFRSASAQLIGSAQARGLCVVASRHSFERTDSVSAMLKTFAAMSDAGADVAKIAMMPRRPADVADVLRATAEADADLDCPVLGIAMGELGRASRILGGDFGSCATFAQMGTASAPGQIAVSELAALLDDLYG